MIADVVSIAATQIGVHEPKGQPNGGLPFTRYGMRGEQELPWCARFARWCFVQAGRTLPGNPYEIASVVLLQAALEKAGAWLGADATPRRGDLILLKHRGGSDPGHGHHVGIVERVEDGLVHSIDGNWGDAVRRVQRSLGSSEIWGFGRWPKDPEG